MKKWLLVWILSGPVAAAADEPAGTGPELYGQCLLYIEISPMPWAKKVMDYNESIGACLSFMNKTIVNSKSGENTRDKNYCLPDDITDGQLAALFVQFAGSYPQLIKEDADGSVSSILEQAYPCD